jgi:hypothetical protein
MPGSTNEFQKSLQAADSLMSGISDQFDRMLREFGREVERLSNLGDCGATELTRGGARFFTVSSKELSPDLHLGAFHYDRRAQAERLEGHVSKLFVAPEKTAALLREICAKGVESERNGDSKRYSKIVIAVARPYLEGFAALGDRLSGLKQRNGTENDEVSMQSSEGPSR